MPRKPNAKPAMTHAEQQAVYRERRSAALRDTRDRILAASTLEEAKAIAHDLTIIHDD